jgi:VPDSG-CTERM motif
MLKINMLQTQSSFLLSFGIGVAESLVAKILIRVKKNKSLMKKKWAILCGIVAAVAVTTAVQAIPISGTISMGGEADFDNTDFTLATTVTSWPLIYVVADSGAFSSVADFTMVNMSAPWAFAPAPGQALSDLWNVDGFQFDLQSDSVSQSQDFLTIYGFGTISGNGYDPTAFEWELSAEDPTTGGSAQITFSATAEPTSNIATVPDGGLTLALLGLALAGVEGLRRKLSKA